MAPRRRKPLRVMRSSTPPGRKPWWRGGPVLRRATDQGQALPLALAVPPNHQQTLRQPDGSPDEEPSYDAKDQPSPANNTPFRDAVSEPPRAWLTRKWMVSTQAGGRAGVDLDKGLAGQQHSSKVTHTREHAPDLGPTEGPVARLYGTNHCLPNGRSGVQWYYQEMRNRIMMCPKILPPPISSYISYHAVKITQTKVGMYPPQIPHVCEHMRRPAPRRSGHPAARAFVVLPVLAQISARGRLRLAKAVAVAFPGALISKGAAPSKPGGEAKSSKAIERGDEEVPRVLQLPEELTYPHELLMQCWMLNKGQKHPGVASFVTSARPDYHGSVAVGQVSGGSQNQITLVGSDSLGLAFSVKFHTCVFSIHRQGGLFFKK